VRRRDDGYHELRTIFQTVDLADELELERFRSPVGEVRLEVAGADLPTDERNLAARAARQYLRAWGPAQTGLALRLTKRIPAGGGLGGGSSNAAAVLLALGRLLGNAPAAAELDAMARGLGADVPFFLVGGTALGTGRGDLVEPLPDPPGDPLALWLVTPPFALSTPAVFAALGAGVEPRSPRGPLARLLAGVPAASLLELVGENDLEAPAFRLRPELAALYTGLESSGAIRIRLCGSGSTLFACFQDSAAGESAIQALPPGFQATKVVTLGRSAWREASGLGPLEGG
jgi:4-diphosphocytidyl-2-C-methyl-D-erythritol kinase